MNRRERAYALLVAMEDVDPVLYGRIIDPPRFAFRFNELVKFAMENDPQAPGGIVPPDPANPLKPAPSDGPRLKCCGRPMGWCVCCPS